MTLKWKHVRILVLLVAVVLGMSSFFVYWRVQRTTPIQAGNRGWGPPELPILGQEVSLEQAQTLVPFKIRFPTNMGSPMEIKACEDMVAIIYAAHKPSTDATISDVLDQDGVILFECTNNMTLEESAQNILAAINSTKNDPGGGLQLVKINGYTGYTGGNSVAWYTETTRYDLRAKSNYAGQQLIAIAQSIPVK